MRPLYALFLVVAFPLFARAFDEKPDYVRAARALQSMSDEDFAAQFKDAGATRLEALSGVYQKLAQVQYEQSQAAAADQAQKAALAARLERLRPEVAKTEKTGYWSNLWQGLQEGSGQERYHYGNITAVAAVRGGRELKSDAERKLADFSKEQDSLMKELADTGSDKCGLYRRSGELYERMAETAQGAPAATADEAAPLRAAAERVRLMSDEEYDAKIRPLATKPLPPRLEALSNVYARLAKIQYERARAQAADDAKRQAELDAALDVLRSRVAATEKAGWFSNFSRGVSNYLNSEPVRRSDVEAAVTAVRGGREMKSDADRQLASLAKEQDAVLAELTQGHDEAELYQKSGRLYDRMSSAALSGAPAPGSAQAAPAPAPAPAVVLSPREIYQRVGPSVVFVFGAADAGGEIGTGSLIDGGHVLTNAHVVIREATGEPWPSIRVYLKPAKITGDNKKDLQNPIVAKVARFDRRLDLAVLELQDPPAGLTPITVGDSASVSPGDPVVAIGHPEQGGLWTLTQGVIGTVLANFEKVPGKDVFQTDASINRGNSGGPLLARDGAMIGVNTAMSRRAADGLAITAVNFSVQSDVVKSWLAGTDFKLASAAPAAAPGGDAGLVTVVEPPKAAPAPAPAPVVAETPRPAPSPAQTAPAILTPAKPYKAEDLIQQEMAQMEDLEKEMQQEVQRVRSTQ